MVSFEWGNQNKVLPNDKLEIKEALKTYLLNPKTSFATYFNKSLKYTTKRNQKEEFLNQMNDIYEEVMGESAYDFLEKSERFIELLGSFPKDTPKEQVEEQREKAKKKLKNITFKKLLEDTRATNDLVGFSFTRFGRDLQKLPKTYEFLAKPENERNIVIEAEFKLFETKKKGQPSGNISFSVQNNSKLDEAHIVFDLVDQKTMVDSKKKYLKNKGVSQVRFITQKRGVAKKQFEEYFNFPIVLPEIAKISAPQGIETVRVSKYQKIKGTKREDFIEAKPITQYFNKKDAMSVFRIISELSQEDKTRIFTFRKVKYKVEDYGQIKRSVFIKEDFSDELEDIAINWYKSNKNKLIKPVKHLLNSMTEINDVVINCKIVTTTRSKGSLSGYLKRTKLPKFTAEGKINEQRIESLEEIITTDYEEAPRENEEFLDMVRRVLSNEELPEDNKEKIKELLRQIEYLNKNRGKEDVPKQLKEKNYTYTLKGAPKGTYAQKATKKVEAYKLKKSKQIIEMIRNNKLYDSEIEVEVNKDFRIDANKFIRERNKKRKEGEKEKEILEETYSLNNFIVLAIVNNKVRDKTKPQESDMYDTFQRPILVRKDDKNFEEIKTRINTLNANKVGENGRMILSDLFDKIYEKTTVMDFDISDKKSFLTKKQYDVESKKEDSERLRLVNKKQLSRIDRENIKFKEEYETITEERMVDISEKERRKLLRIKSLSPEEMKNKITQLKKQIKQALKVIQIKPLTSERAVKLDKETAFVVDEGFGETAKVKTLAGLGEIYIGEAAPKEDLPDILKNSEIQCRYSVQRLGYFDFDPSSKAGELKGINKKLLEDIKKLKVANLGLKRLGLGE